MRSSVRLFVRLSVCLPVTLVICIKTVQARITKFSLWAAPRTLAFLWQNFMPLGKAVPFERGRQRGVPFLNVILPLLARLVWKWLQINTDMLHIITCTGDGLFRFINIDDLEWFWTPKRGVFHEFFAISACDTHSKSELHRNGWK